jgi:hypothetical protein
VCAIAGLAAGIALLTAGVLYASSAPCTAPPAPDAKKRTVAQGHARASSYAPQPRPRNHAYGTPIQRPILSKHKRTKRRADKSAPK